MRYSTLRKLYTARVFIRNNQQFKFIVNGIPQTSSDYEVVFESLKSNSRMGKETKVTPFF